DLPTGRALVPQHPGDLLGPVVALADRVAPTGVVVHAPDVALGVFPSVVGDHRPGTVQRLGQVVQGGRVVLLLGDFGDVPDAPALVERHPRDHARMAAVPAHDVEPFPGQP